MRARHVENLSESLYDILGVSPAATMAELRRAYRLLALEHHPDRAGPESAPRFAKIAEAYGILSDATARAAYDAHVFEKTAWGRGAGTDGGGGGGTVAGGGAWNVGTNAWSASWRRPVPDLLRRLSGPLPALIAAGAARGDGQEGFDLILDRGEAARGGTAVVTLSLKILCPTCGGVAHPRGVWCRRCEFAGQVTDEVSVSVQIPRAVPDGFLARATMMGASGEAPRVRVRVRE